MRRTLGKAVGDGPHHLVNLLQTKAAQSLFTMLKVVLHRIRARRAGEQGAQGTGEQLGVLA